ncbi:hypothetical protein EUX98_g967 [Antrodiella citrinella]|uniref:LsmAD domain-containing protein n=1 Tax=Antrodiella citrinella TaxID=2447956 RepID=A0A4S4N483_9APHY|nr:hypothetical protein EUX98_g967 [Antrodiella citrinella]
MATTARQPKQPRKGMPEPAARRAPAWGGSRASPTFSPGVTNARLPNPPAPASPGAFPPLAPQNGAPRPQDRLLQQLSGLTGTTITLSTKTGQRYEGVVASTGGEGDTTGVTLKDVKELTAPGAPLKETYFVASTNIDTWSCRAADAKAPNGDGFKTDTDISKQGSARRERELQAWQPVDTSAENNQASASSQILSAINVARQHTDDATFGPGASSTSSWDQFDVNEKLFGVKASFDEEQYTTKLDRNAPDFKEKEKKAQQLANEILQSTVNNVHVAEERVMNFTGTGDNGTNEEEKYGAVVRSVNAYVPPGARGKNIPAPAAAAAAADAANGAKADVLNVSVTINAPDGTAIPTDPSTAASPNAKPPAAADAAFREFVTSEKDRLLKKKQALMDKRMADLVKFSKSFKLNKPIPDDLVPILAKDEAKQRQIKEKSSKDAESTHARAIGPLTTTATSSNTSSNNPSISRLASPAAPNSAKPPSAEPQIVKAAAANKSVANLITGKTVTKADAAANKRISMVIQAIPAFKGKRVSMAPPITTNVSGPSAANGTNGVLARANANANTNANINNNNNNVNSPLSPTSQNRLNVNASSFRPTSKPFSPSATPSANGSASPKPKVDSPPQSNTPNPFFGARALKKGPPVHIKDDFNPFKSFKVAEASSIGSNWSYSGKRYMTIFPPAPAVQPQQQSPHMAPPPPPVTVPPPPYTDEDPQQQQAPRGYLYYPPYGYPPQMMPGMAPPPPGAYMPGPFMQPMPYPMPPNVQHAVPYPMMMPPPGAPGGPPHPYESGQAPVPMGGVGHA